MQLFLFYLLLLFALTELSGQTSSSVLLRGQVVDSISGTPMEYATISIFNHNNKLISGSITSRNGTFSVALEPGIYHAEIQFLSYKKTTIPELRITAEKPMSELGIIKMQELSANLDEATVTGEKSEMIISLDKKVFNVGKDLSNTGKSVLDILDNIPSIAVDVDGNVSVRGSQEIQVLIDGKPSGLVSAGNTENLRNLQGNMIERIELITNPSARYEAQGMSGIINIVLKKDQQKGINGSFEAGIGNPDNYTIGANINFRRTKMNYFLNYTLHYHERPGSGHSYQYFDRSDTTYITLVERNRNRTGLTNRVRGGFDYFLNPNNVITTAFMLAIDDHNNTSKVYYNDFTSARVLIQTTSRSEKEKSTKKDMEYTLNYERKFKTDKHKLTAFVHYIEDYDKENSEIEEQVTSLYSSIDTSKLQQSTNKENERNFLIQADYVYPFGNKGTFETGYRSEFRNISNPYLVKEKVNENTWEPLTEFSNTFEYTENTYALYMQAGNNFNALSVQVGIRSELSDIKTHLWETGEKKDTLYLDLFPTLHVSYQINQANSMQLSYSRRINRPDFRMLNPFHSYSDSRNIRTGNPYLRPEYTHALEAGYLNKQSKTDLYAGIYYRYTTDVVEHFPWVDTLGITYTMPINLSKRHAFGIEANLSLNPYKWWIATASGNFYRKITEGEYLTKKLSSDDYSWDLRFNSKIRIPKFFDFQTVLFYRAPEETTQGNRKAFYFINAAISKDILKGNGTLTLNIQDLLNSRKMRFVLSQSEMYSDNEFRWASRSVTLTFIYRLNQKKGMKNRENDQDESPVNGNDMME